jgi:hypothetical protein
MYVNSFAAIHFHNDKQLTTNHQNYAFGKTVSLPLKQFYQAIRDLLSRLRARPGPLFLVFHDAVGDLKYVEHPSLSLTVTSVSEYCHRYLTEQIGVTEVQTATHLIPDQPSNDGVYIVDTSQLFAALEGHSAQRRNLERMCRLLGMRYLEFMHNAGNDAHVCTPILTSAHT